MQSLHDMILVGLIKMLLPVLRQHTDTERRTPQRKLLWAAEEWFNIYGRKEREPSSQV